LTRSVRNDYRDPDYARLAFEARRLWRDFERECGRRLLVDCGGLNLVKDTVTPNLASTYAVESYAVLEQLQLRREARFEMAHFALRARELGADYVGICCGAGPHHVRAMAEALGRETPASRYSPSMDLHPMFRADVRPRTPRSCTAGRCSLAVQA
jgi:glycine/D-amino acid oxidase-like deaminating enzyme